MDPYGAYANADASRIAAELLQTEGDAVNIVDEATAFARRCADFADDSSRTWDVVHAHDWLTFPAAERAARLSKCPWIAHFHSTEWDRRGDKASEVILQIEKDACRAADKIVVPSAVLGETLVRVLAADRTKISIVPNCFEIAPEVLQRRGSFDNKTVIFAGRITYQKGPEYFIEAAVRIRHQLPVATFTMYGEGDMVKEIRAAIVGRFHRPRVIPPVRAKQPASQALAVHVSNVIVPTHNSETGLLSYKHTSSPSSLDRELEKRIEKGGFTVTPMDDLDGYCLVTFGEGLNQEDFLVKGSGHVLEHGPSVVTMKGFVDWSVRHEMFNGASAIVVPSRSEPFGMIILEAMEYGVPVFYAKHAGVSEVLEPDLSIDPEDAQAVAEKVCGLLADERRWHEVVEEQRRVLLKFMSTPYEDEIARTWASLRDPGELGRSAPGPR